MSQGIAGDSLASYFKCSDPGKRRIGFRLLTLGTKESVIPLSVPIQIWCGCVSVNDCFPLPLPRKFSKYPQFRKNTSSARLRPFRIWRHNRSHCRGGK